MPVFNVTGTPLDKSVFNANKRDVLRSAVALIRKNRFNANFIVINPMDGATMELEKGNDGHYILPPFTSVDGTKIGATLIIENEAIAEGEFLAGDFTKSNLRIKEEININIGHSDDDFVKNLVTILAEMRAVHYIKNIINQRLLKEHLLQRLQQSINRKLFKYFFHNYHFPHPLQVWILFEI